MTTAADVIVVGGGPAGYASAIALASQGMSVALVERRTGPVDKACGEGLMPGAVKALAKAGIDVEGHPLTGVHYASADGSRNAVGRFRGGTGLGVRRTALSEAFERRAAELGVVRHTGRVTDLREEPGGVTAQVAAAGDGPSSLTAGYAVVADGLHSPLRRRMGWDNRSGGGTPARYGLRRHYRLAPGVTAGDQITVFWAADCEVYVTPVGDDVVNVAVLCRGGHSYEHWTARVPALQALLRGAAPLTAVRGAGPLRQRARCCASDRVVLAGDAAGYVDALTGEGIGIAMSAADVLAGCLAADQARRYPKLLRRATARPRVLTEVLLRVSSAGRLRQALVPASERLPRTFSYFVNALA